MKRPGDPRIHLTIGTIGTESRAEVEDALACAGIDFIGEPQNGGRIRISIRGGRSAQAEARAILSAKGGARSGEIAGQETRD